MLRMQPGSLLGGLKTNKILSAALGAPPSVVFAHKQQVVPLQLHWFAEQEAANRGLNTHYLTHLGLKECEAERRLQIQC